MSSLLTVLLVSLFSLISAWKRPVAFNSSESFKQNKTKKISCLNYSVESTLWSYHSSFKHHEDWTLRTFVTTFRPCSSFTHGEGLTTRPLLVNVVMPIALCMDFTGWGHTIQLLLPSSLFLFSSTFYSLFFLLLSSSLCRLPVLLPLLKKLSSVRRNKLLYLILNIIVEILLLLLLI